MMNPYTCRDLKFAATCLREAQDALQQAREEFRTAQTYLEQAQDKVHSRFLACCLGFGVALVTVLVLAGMAFYLARRRDMERGRFENESAQLFQILAEQGKFEAHYNEIRDEMTGLKRKIDDMATTTQQLLLLELGVEEHRTVTISAAAT